LLPEEVRIGEEEAAPVEAVTEPTEPVGPEAGVEAETGKDGEAETPGEAEAAERSDLLEDVYDAGGPTLESVGTAPGATSEALGELSQAEASAETKDGAGHGEA